jgi:hypothetical protein
MMDVTQTAMWSSGTPTIASVNTAGLVTAHGAGNVTITATVDSVFGNATLSIASPLMAVAQTSPEIDIFDAFAVGDAAPLRTIKGPTTLLGSTSSIQVVGTEIFVSDPNKFAVDVFPLAGVGDTPPLRQVIGANTTLSTNAVPYGMTVDNGEIFVGAATSVAVFPISANGNATPSRVLAGAATTFAGVTSVAVYKGELYVLNGGNKIDVFPATASGNVAPTRTITGSNTQMPNGFLGSFKIEVALDEIYVTALGTSVLVFATTDSGNVAPRRVITGPTAKIDCALGSQVVGPELYLMNLCSDATSGAQIGLQVFSDAATVGGDPTPVRTMVGASLVNPWGICVF